MENRKTLVDSQFRVPTGLVTDRFVLRMLTIHDLVKDYDAVISSKDHLKNTFSRISGSDWPDGLTLEENLIDLGWHQREFTLRYSFAYTVISPDELSCLLVPEDPGHSRTGCNQVNFARSIPLESISPYSIG